MRLVLEPQPPPQGSLDVSGALGEGAAAGPLQKAGLLEDAMGLAGRFFEGLEIDAEILRAVGVSQSDAGGVGRSLRDAKRALELMGAPESVTNGLGEAAALYEGFSGGSLESVFNTIGGIYGLGKGGVNLATEFSNDPAGTAQRIVDAIDARAAEAARGAEGLAGQVRDGSIWGNIGDGIRGAFDARVRQFVTTAASQGREAAFNELGNDLGNLFGDIAQSFIPIGRAARVADPVALRPSVAARVLNSASRLALGRILPGVLAGGARRLGWTEARGIVYAARQADRLGFELVDSLVYNGSGHGADLLFRRTLPSGATEFAVFEAKGGANATLRTYGGAVQGSSAYNARRIERWAASAAGRANPTLTAELLAATRSNSVASYATSYRHRWTDRLVSPPGGTTITRSSVDFSNPYGI